MMDTLVLLLIITAFIVGSLFTAMTAGRRLRKEKHLQEQHFTRFRQLLFGSVQLSVDDTDPSHVLPGVDSTRERTVTVITGDGIKTDASWLGFITREENARYPGRYAWIHAAAVVQAQSSSMQSRHLAREEFVQGWLTGNGVYAVTDNNVAIIR